MERIHSALNKELIKRLLVQYFTQKGFIENFDTRLYPPMIQDLPIQIPQLASKVEVQPNVMNIDPQTGVVQLGWNLFVLGTERLTLGESSHTNLNEVQSAIAGPLNGTQKMSSTTPKRIINFIIEVLGNSKDGDISSIPANTTNRSPLGLGTGENSGYYRHSQRPVF